MTYSLLVWDDASSIPFPEEVKEVVKNVEWNKLEWNVVGLPIGFAKYSLSGKTLYLEETPSGQVTIEKQDFTGDVRMASYFVNEKEGEDDYNYFVEFQVTFVKGEVSEIVWKKTHRQLCKEYKAQLGHFQNEVKKKVKMASSFWYKWIYGPYFFIVRGIGTVFVFILSLLINIIWRVVKLLTPI